MLEALEELGLRPEVRRLGPPDRFTAQGQPESLHAEAGIVAAGTRKALALFGVAPGLSTPRAG